MENQDFYILGNEISPFLYDDISEAKNGLSVVKYQNRKGVIDQQSRWVITPYNDSISIGKRRIYIEQGYTRNWQNSMATSVQRLTIVLFSFLEATA